MTSSHKAINGGISQVFSTSEEFQKGDKARLWLVENEFFINGVWRRIRLSTDGQVFFLIYRNAMAKSSEGASFRFAGTDLEFVHFHWETRRTFPKARHFTITIALKSAAISLRYWSWLYSFPTNLLGATELVSVELGSASLTNTESLT